MCVRTNSSYSPRRLTSSSAFTKRRFSVAVRVAASLRTYAMPASPVLVPRFRTGLAQPLAGGEGVRGGTGGVERCRVGAVVVDHAQPGAVGPAHQVQGAAVEGDVPVAVRGPYALDAAAPVHPVEGGAVRGPFRCAEGGEQGRQGRGERAGAQSACHVPPRSASR